MIVVDRVSKFYGLHAAVRDLNFEIEEGECVGFLGLNGAGKSTTLRLLSCLLLPTSGRIKIRGFDAEDQPHEIRKLIGFLPDDPPLYPEMGVASFLRFAGKLRRMTRAEVEKRLPEVLDICDLNRVADQPIETLSHGYQQRVGIAQAIVHRPTLLILDEPIQGLDPVQIVEMRKLVRSLRGEHTILLSSHILSEVERTCDRLLLLRKGQIVAEGSEEEIVARMGEVPAVHGQAQAHQVIELDVRGDRAALELALAPLKGEIIEAAPLSDGVLRVRVTFANDPREEVARAVVGAGLGLLTLRRAQTSLEDVFVQLSRDEDRVETETEVQA